MRSVRLRILLLSVALCTTTVGFRAQQTFRSTTALLTLDVSVLDRDGNPVTGLTPDDFVVTLNKEAEPVRTMIFLATQNQNKNGAFPAQSSEAPPSSQLAPTMAARREPDSKLLVILVDDLSIHPTDSKGLFVSAERFVNTIPARDWVGLASSSGQMAVSPSLDRTRLLKDLGHVFGSMSDPRRDGQFVGFMDALEADMGSEASLRSLIETACGLPANTRNLGQLLAESPCAHEITRKSHDNATFARIMTRNQLASYIAVIKAMASAPGVKQLVILTGGIAVRPADSLDFVPVATAAAAAGVQITILMEEPQEDMTVPSGWVKDQRRMLQQAETLAEMSGGQLFHVIGQADRFYQRILRSAGAIYRIGVDLPKTIPPDGNYRVSVSVKRPGLRVLASRYANPPAPQLALTPEERMQHAIANGESLFDLPMLMSVDIVPPRGGSPLAIHVSIDVPGEMASPVSGVLGVSGTDRVLKTSHHELLRSGDGKMYSLDLLVPAVVGVYELRFAAADASGAVGAVTRTIVVKAPDSQASIRLASTGSVANAVR